MDMSSFSAVLGQVGREPPLLELLVSIDGLVDQGGHSGEVLHVQGTPVLALAVEYANKRHLT